MPAGHRHEPSLNDTTDAYDKFPERTTSYVIDGNNVSGIFACDLTLAELLSLRARQPWPFRDQQYNGRWATLRCAVLEVCCRSCKC
jgi:glycerophosphoryl diester phosphodiesterase